MVLFMCNLVCYVELWEIYKSGSVFGLWLTLGVSFSKPISYFSTVIRSCTSLVHTAYGLLSHTAPCVAAYTAFFFLHIREDALFPLCPWKNSLPDDVTTACQGTRTWEGQMHFYSVAFPPFKPLISPPAAAFRNSVCWIQHPALAAGTREAPVQVPLAEPQPRLLPPEEGREGPSFLQSPVCTITSPLRNSALVIENAKICTT